MIDYAGIHGSNLGLDDGIIVENKTYPTIANPAGTPLSKAVKPMDIEDGLSQTLMFAEKRMNIGRLGFSQSDDDGGYTSGFDHDNNRGGRFAPAPDYRSSNPADHGGGAVGSSHPGVFLGAFADGSVRAFRHDLDLVTVFRPLTTRKGRDVFNLGQ